jgi:hypothetical protein
MLVSRNETFKGIIFTFCNPFIPILLFLLAAIIPETLYDLDRSKSSFRNTNIITPIAFSNALGYRRSILSLKSIFIFLLTIESS